MPISRTDLREHLKKGGDFTLPARAVGLEQVWDLFSACFPSGEAKLTGITERDLAALRVTGTAAKVTGVGTNVRASLTFLVDPRSDEVGAVRLEVFLPGFQSLPHGLDASFTSLADLGFSDPRLVLTATDCAPPVPGRQVGLSVAYQPVSGKTVRLTGMQDTTTGRCTFAGECTGVTFSSLSALASVLPKAGTADLTVPKDLGITQRSGLELTRLALCWQTRTKRFHSASVRVRFADTWAVVPGVISLGAVSVDAELVRGATKPSVFLGFRGTLTVGGVTVGASVDPYRELQAEFRTPVELTKLPTEFRTGLELPDLKTGRLRVLARHTEKSYELDGLLEGSWQLAGVTLTGLRLYVEGRSGASPAGALEAGLSVGGAAFGLEGGYSAANGWQLAGGLAPGSRLTGAQLTAWLQSTLKVPAGDIPPLVKTLTLQDAELGFASKRREITFSCGLTASAFGLPQAVAVRLVAKAEGPTTSTGNGKVSFAAEVKVRIPTSDGRTHLVELRGDIAKNAGENAVVTVSGTSSSGWGLASLLKALGVDPGGLPLSALPTFTSLTVGFGQGGHLVRAATERGHAVTVAGGSGWSVVQARFKLTAGLSSLDLLHGQLPAGQDVSVSLPLVRYAPKPIPEATMKAWRTWYGDQAAKELGLPGGAVPAGIRGTVLLRVGTADRQQEIALGSTAPKGQEATPVDAPLDVGTEVRLDRSVGPLRVHGLGIRLTGDRVTVDANASLSIAGVELQVDGLGLSVELKEPHTVRPALRGVLLSVSAGAAEVAGALLYTRPPRDSGFTDQFDGMLLLRLPTVSGRLLGQLAYATGGSAWSFSAFGELAAEGGGGFGPPPFRVTGAMLGGGYNATVRVPAPHEVQDFPLVAGLGNPNVAKQTPARMAKGLVAAKWLSPKQGQNWVAVGIQFTSFEFLAGRVLALVEFGDDLSVGLFGLLKATFPTRLAPGGAVYAQIELAMRALYQRGPGLLSFTALLTGDSYVLTPSCKLTGGLAVSVWSPPEPGKGPDRSGDFVITLGGYHPLYPVPGHYPQVPRLGASLAISKAVSFTAGVYLAVTPGALMLGSDLAVVFDGGWVQAWFTASFHGYLQWTNPPRYDFRLGVRVGFRADISVGPIHVTVRAEVSADCLVWGDPFGGRATVRSGPVSFTVPFGSGGADDRPVAWPDFQRQLPPPLKATVASGLLPAPKVPGATTQPWTVAGDGFSFVTAGVAPATSLVIGLPDGKEHTVRSATDKVTIRPLRESGVTSVHKVTVTKDGKALNLIKSGEAWTIEADTGDVPEALWGSPDRKTGHLLAGRLVGIRLTAPARQPGRSPGRITPAALSRVTVPNSARMPLTSAMQGVPPVRESTSVGKVAKIDLASAKTARAAVLNALRNAGAEAMVRDETKPLTDPPVPLRDNALSRYARDVESAFTNAPLVATES
ncbi:MULTISPECIES: DUF6603 domain-containing protein [Streptomyces]|uniref:DUF6603 domain-containing protein n=1 Tax=Streptomyces TaxID=1883 RepID=UPI00163C9288|nr:MULTISPECIES: DUF6603 domain-containing protein [Streptomyces]MBC2877497.1 hypothetical protein [Streptomyces sp. TYQ1024]UBI36258.1 hypothetical protein K7I03_07155 [Streptomyces mobaraensis]UKW28852.1 hypothetical protein MCU78_07140 [Streptomyces sp. TYQ1024]